MQATPAFATVPAAFAVERENGMVVITRTAADAPWNKAVDETPMTKDANPVRVIVAELLNSRDTNVHFGYSVDRADQEWVGNTGISFSLNNFSVYIQGADKGRLPGAPADNSNAVNYTGRKFALQLDLRYRRLDAFWTEAGEWKHVKMVASDQQIPACDAWYAAVGLHYQNDKLRLAVHDVATRPHVFRVYEPATELAPCYQQVVDADLPFEETLRRPAVGQAGAPLRQFVVAKINVAVAGTPGMGKSALTNALGSCVAGMPVQLVDESVSKDDNNATLRFSRVPLLTLALMNKGQAPQPGFECVLFDMPGMRGRRELVAMMQGKLKNNAEWPMPKVPPVTGREMSAEEAADTQRVEAARLALENPNPMPGPLEAAHCAVLVMDADTLIAGGGESQFPRDIVSVCKSMHCNTDFAVQLPKLLVITKVDLWAAKNGIGARDCVLGGDTGPLAPLYKAAQEQLGFPAQDVVPIGWLGCAGSSAINYAARDDPRVVALRYLAQRMSQCACTMQRKNFSELLPDN